MEKAYQNKHIFFIHIGTHTHTHALHIHTRCNTHKHPIHLFIMYKCENTIVCLMYIIFGKMRVCVVYV